MKGFKLFFLLLIYASVCNAQKYVPFPKHGAVWQEMYQADNGAYHDGYVYHIKQEKDTVIDSVKYILLSTVERHGHRDQFGNYTYSYYKGLYGAMREDSNKHVFFYDLKEKKEHLLYDFNMQIGDTIPAYIRDFDGYKIVSIDSVLIDTSYRKQYAVGNHRIDAYIIEGIGSTQGLKNKITLQFEVFFSLRCFSLDGKSIYSDLNDNCEIVVSVEEFTKNKVKFNVFPNPTSGNFTIQTQSIFSDSYICVRDVLGRIVHNEKLQFSNQTINISSHPNGLYFVELYQNGNKSVMKIILE